jgi:hypothetical protein
LLQQVCGGNSVNELPSVHAALRLLLVPRLPRTALSLVYQPPSTMVSGPLSPAGRAVVQMLLTPATTSMLLVANSDIPAHDRWRKLLETSVDTVLHLQVLPTGRAAEVNMQVTVTRPNRWGRAVEEGPPAARSLDVEQHLFAHVSDRTIIFRPTLDLS